MQVSSSVCLVLHLLSPPSPPPSLLVLLLLLLLCSGSWLSAAVAERDMATHRSTSTIISRTRFQAGIHYTYCTASVSPSASLWSANSNTLLHRWVIDLLRGETAGQLVGVRNCVGLLEHPSHPLQDQQSPLHLSPTICGFNQAQKKNTPDYGWCIYFITMAIIVGHIVSCNDIMLLMKREGPWRELPCRISRSQRKGTKLRNRLPF